ncbi:MAG: nicotinate (nicotinamide) nucleotide adenylyltransferase [Burkholderiales bacterium]|jgi:nicotinate-nucleotide adenylyltransferase|nr:nicotinate (nicotinamide) nucleotide adenylyltransferase [Burkholderiales bacterium]
MTAATTGVRRIGLLGGSFDPPHHAHLQLARQAQQALGLEQVRFVIAAQPWQKTGVSPSQHRLAMLQLALQHHDGLAIETCELERTGPSYAIDTLRELRQRYGPQAMLVWILGSDQYFNLPTWHQHEQLLHYANFAVVQRQASAKQKDQLETLPEATGLTQPRGQTVRFFMPALDISSTAIRQAIAHGAPETVQGLLAPAVLTYILDHHLYSTSL